jgi:YegS/Rv2252/BmrU family lipid kinase
MQKDTHAERSLNSNAARSVNSAEISHFIDQEEQILEAHTASTASVATSKTAILIANPASGSYIHNATQIVETVSFLCQHGWQATLHLTHEAGDAGRLAREAVAQQVDVVIAVGGDGTINEIIQELAESETALGVLPSGTVNVWAREVGIPLDNAGAREVLLYGRTRRIDLGQIEGRYFLLMVGIGIDGEVTRTVERKPLKRLGIIGYLVVALWMALGYRGFRVWLELNSRTIKMNALQVIVGNTQLYAGALKYTWRAKCDDGLLDICIVRKQNVFGRIRVMLDLFLRLKKRYQRVHYETGQVIKIRTREPIAIQLDGEPFERTSCGDTPTILRVAANALKVIVPHNTTASIFSQIHS